jgi:hypothetical protein
MYDPKSGVNVTDFVSLGERNGSIQHAPLKYLCHVAETNEVWGINSRKTVVSWRFNPHASLTVLSGHSDIIECIASNTAEPLLIYTGAADGSMRRWERTQVNPFLYTQENLSTQRDTVYDSRSKDAPVFRSTLHRNSEKRRKLQVDLHKHIEYKLGQWRSHVEHLNGGPSRWADVVEHQLGLMSETARETFTVQQRQLKRHAKKLGVFVDDDHQSSKETTNRKTTFVRVVYLDKMDMLIGSSDDGDICTHIVCNTILIHL